MTNVNFEELFKKGDVISFDEKFYYVIDEVVS